MSDTSTFQVYRDVGARPLERGSKHAAGLDIGAFLTPENGYDKYQLVLGPGERHAVPTGIYVCVPEGHYGRVAPRSGLAYKYGIDTLAGVIDSDYRGEVKVILLNTSQTALTIINHERIAQLILEKISILEPVEVMLPSELGATERGEGGFGSTGRV